MKNISHSEESKAEPLRPPDAAWYALRRTLPPWRHRENLDELVQLLPRYRVNELIVKIDTEEFWHGQPQISSARAGQSSLFEIKAALGKLGIKYSLNPWITQGHGDRGRDDRQKIPGFQGLIGHDGAACRSCACPLGEGWLMNTAAVWQLYAETEPHVLWIEDDIRTFNHEPVEYSCFCPLHLARFSERVGVPIDRESLVAAILKPGTPHAWRREYMEMQAEIMIEVCRFLAEAVHKVSPRTSMGLMSSGVRTHCLEGRKWTELSHAISGGNAVYSRPPLANYYETSLRGLYYSQDAIKGTRFCLPSDVIEHTEVENFPFSKFSKSVTFTFLQMALSFAYGSHGVSLNLFDHCGTPMGNDPDYGNMLGKRKAYLNALAARAQQKGIMRGVRLLHHEESSFFKRLEHGGGYPSLEEDGSQIMEMLESCGIPTTMDDSPIAATSGQQLRAFSDAEISALLRGGLLLDGTAAKVLHERGFGEEIGLADIQNMAAMNTLGTFAAEEFHNRNFEGEERMYLTIPAFGHRPGYGYYQASLAEGVEVISHLVDPDASRKLPLFYAFENRQGGRVIVYLMDLVTIYSEGFNHPHRQRQLHAMVRWLAQGQFPLLAHAVYPLTFRRDFGDTSLIGLFNLTLDTVQKPLLECSDQRAIKMIERLIDDQWVADDSVEISTKGTSIQLRFLQELAYHEPLFLTVYWGNDTHGTEVPQ